MTDQPTPLHEQVRTLEADLVMCREQLAQETDRAEKAELPEPDPTNPAHLRWVADLLTLIVLRDGNAKYSNDYGDSVDFRASILKGRADRLKAAQQQADTDEELIEKAAQVLHDEWVGVTPWDDETPGVRERWLRLARALHAANLLRDGDRKADGGLTTGGGISNGQLLAMEPERREETIASLSLEVRRKLANIACLGASRLIKESVCDDSHHKAKRADELTELAANLLRDGGEK